VIRGPFQLLSSAGSNVETNWLWVVVLEVFQIGTANRAHLVRDRLSSRAEESGNDDVLTWSNRTAPEF